MRIQLKYVLPVTQVAVAIFLLHQYQMWIVLTRHNHMPGPGVASTLLDLINLPVALLRGFWFKSFDFFWPDWIFVVALAIFWYWAGREIESRLDGRTPVTIKSRLARIVIDVLLAAFSVSFFLRSHIDLRSLLWPYFVPTLLFVLLWIVAPLTLLGYDLFSLARKKWRSLEP